MSSWRAGILPKPAAQVSSFLDWLRVQAGIDRYDLAVIRFTADTPQGVFIPGVADVDRNGLVNSLPWLRYENSHAAGAYFRPARGHAWPLVFLDDVSQMEARRLSDTYSAAVIETSPDRFHVWLAADQALGEHGRYLAQTALAQQTGADKGSVSGEHWGRLPGFRNNKPGKHNWVNLRRLSTLRPYPVSLCSADTVAVVKEQATTKCTIPGTEQDESAAEWKFVRSALEAGVPPDAVHRRLLERCANRRGSDARRYADLTMYKACKKGGLVYGKDP